MTSNRPVSVTIIAWLMIVVGVIAIAVHIPEFNWRHAFDVDGILALLVNALAVVSGVFMLRGQDWARWLTLAWWIFHVAISFAVMRQLIVHALVLAVIAFFLLRPPAARYFRGPRVPV